MSKALQRESKYKILSLGVERNGGGQAMTSLKCHVEMQNGPRGAAAATGDWKEQRLTFTEWLFCVKHVSTTLRNLTGQSVK